MAFILAQGKQQYFDDSGNPLNGGKLWTMQPGAGITTPKATWTDAGETALNANPIILNARGEAQVFWSGDYNVRLETAAGGLIWTVENIAARSSATIISVLDYGAVGNGVADDTDEIKAAIAANPGKTIVLGNQHKISGTITISSDNTYLVGSGQRSVITQITPDIDSVLFKPTTAGTTSAFLNNVGIENVSVNHAASAYTTATSGAGLRFLQCNSYRAHNIGVIDAFEGLTVQGGQNGSLTRLNLFVSNGSYAGAGTALLHFRQAPVGLGFDPCYTVTIDDFFMSATLLRDTCIRVSNGDGIGFGIGYVAHGKNSNLLLKAERNNSYISSCRLNGVYLDCVGAGKTLCGVSLEADGFAASFIYDLTIGEGCTIGNGDGVGVLCRKPETVKLRIGSNIVNMKSWAVDVEGSGTYTDLTVTAKMSGCGTNGISGNIRAKTGKILTINAGHASNTNVCLLTDGNWSTGTIYGNANVNACDDWSQLGTFSYPPTIFGNKSTNHNSATSWCGTDTGNIPSDSTTRLDWYKESTFVPTLTFGGAAAGMTYSLQLGEFTRIGNRVLYNLQFVLSAKGASTGVALISGLPYACGSAQTAPAVTVIYNATAGVGDTVVYGLVTSGGTTIKPYGTNAGAGTITQLTDVEFTNTTNVQISGNYMV